MDSDKNIRITENDEKQVWELLENASEIKLDDNFNRSIIAQIKSEPLPEKPFRRNIFVWLAPLTAAAALITVSVLLWRYSENPALPVVAMPGTDIAENDLRVIRNIELLKEMENSEYNIIIKNQKTAEMFLSLLGNKDISEVPTAPATGSIFQSQTDEKPLFCEFRNHFVSTTEMEDINL